MKFPEGVFGSLPRWHNKSKVIIFKIPKIFCTLSGVAISIPEIMVTEIRNLHGFSLSLKALLVCARTLLQEVLCKSRPFLVG